jgi:hypothetical protein
MKGRSTIPAETESTMFNTLIRKSAIAFAAGTLLFVAAPAIAGGWDEPRVIVSEDGIIINGRDTRRPVYDDDYRHEVLSQRQIVRALRHQGYPEVREIGFRHDTYRVVAIRHNGAVVKLKVSALDGRILSERRIGWVRSAPTRIYEHPAPRRHIQPGVSIEFGWSSN